MAVIVTQYEEGGNPLKRIEHPLVDFHNRIEQVVSNAVRDAFKRQYPDREIFEVILVHGKKGVKTDGNS